MGENIYKKWRKKNRGNARKKKRKEKEKKERVKSLQNREELRQKGYDTVGEKTTLRQRGKNIIFRREEGGKYILFLQRIQYKRKQKIIF